MDYKKLALKLHKENRGKIAVSPKVKVADKDDLSLDLYSWCCGS